MGDECDGVAEWTTGRMGRLNGERSEERRRAKRKGKGGRLREKQQKLEPNKWWKLKLSCGGSKNRWKQSDLFK